MSTHALQTLIQRSGITVSDHQRPTIDDIERCLRDDRHVRAVVPSERKEEAIDCAANVAAAYTHCHFDVQVQIARFTFFVTMIDDKDVPKDALTTYVTQRSLEGHPVLTGLADCLDHMHDYFPPYGVGCVMADTTRFINAALLDAMIDGMPLSLEARAFAEYKRVHCGIPEGYAFFIFDKSNFPDPCTYLQMIP